MSLWYGDGFGLRGRFRVLPLSCPLCLDVDTVRRWGSIRRAWLWDNYPRLPGESGESGQHFSSQSARKKIGTYTFLYPFNLSGSATPSER